MRGSRIWATIICWSGGSKGSATPVTAAHTDRRATLHGTGTAPRQAASGSEGASARARTARTTSWRLTGVSIDSPSAGAGGTPALPESVPASAWQQTEPHHRASNPPAADGQTTVLLPERARRPRSRSPCRPRPGNKPNPVTAPRTHRRPMPDNRPPAGAGGTPALPESVPASAWQQTEPHHRASNPPAADGQTTVLLPERAGRPRSRSPCRPRPGNKPNPITAPRTHRRPTARQPSSGLHLSGWAGIRSSSPDNRSSPSTSRGPGRVNRSGSVV